MSARRTLEGQRLARLADALLSCRQRTKIFHGFRHSLSVQTHNDPTGRLAANLNVKEDLVRHLWSRLGLGRTERQQCGHNGPHPSLRSECAGRDEKGGGGTSRTAGPVEAGGGPATVCTKLL
eukprot:scaffold169_cov103-Isochrysis_galbana.AAC.1